MILEALQPLACPLERLAELVGNPRRGDVGAVARSYERFGQRKPIVARRTGGTDAEPTGEVLAGNHQLLAARQLGWESIAVVWVDDDDATASAYALADNRIAELGGYDDADLAALIAGVAEADAELLAASGWTTDDLAELVARLEPPPPALTDPDDVPEAPPAKTVPGDVWLCGPHRVMCGDATVPTDVEALMVGTRPTLIYTDPPYGMALDTNYRQMGHGGGKSYRNVIGDDSDFDPASVLAMFDAVDEQFWWGADYYRARLPAGGSWLVWDKRDNDSGMDLDALFGSAFELCWSRQPHKREIARVLWAMTHGQQRDCEDANRGLHPTQKPVALGNWFLERFSTPGDVVLDLFGGSGSTLIAAHDTGRVAYLMELDPRYVDVICRRYQEHTGDKPIAESTGNPHDFTAD